MVIITDRVFCRLTTFFLINIAIVNDERYVLYMASGLTKTSRRLCVATFLGHTNPTQTHRHDIMFKNIKIQLKISEIYCSKAYINRRDFIDGEFFSAQDHHMVRGPNISAVFYSRGKTNKHTCRSFTYNNIFIRSKYFM